MAYAERRERSKGVRYRGMYKAADGRQRSAGTFSTEERALTVASEAEQHALVAGPAAGRLDPATRATRTIQEYAPLFLRRHQVEGNTKDAYADSLRLHVILFFGGCRLAETDRTVARNYITALQEEGRSANTIRQAKVVLCAMFGMAVADGYLDYNPFHDVKTPKVPGRRAIKVATPEQYLQVRACLPNKPAQLVAPPPRRTKPRLTEEQLRALGDCEPVNGRVYAHGTLGGYVTAKCRCAGCRQACRHHTAVILDRRPGIAQAIMVAAGPAGRWLHDRQVARVT